MRVIAGKLKGKNLETASGLETRPTADRVKEAIFSTIGSDIKDARVLDCFAGSGALGIESLSRGAKEAVFIEGSSQAFNALEYNIKQTKLSSNSTLFLAKAEDKLDKIKTPFDIIFLDPPYNKDIKIIIKLINKNENLKKGGMLVAETSIKEQEDFLLPELNLWKNKKYGNTMISYYFRNIN